MTAYRNFVHFAHYNNVSIFFLASLEETYVYLSLPSCNILMARFLRVFPELKEYFSLLARKFTSRLLKRLTPLGIMEAQLKKPLKPVL